MRDAGIFLATGCSGVDYVNEQLKSCLVFKEVTLCWVFLSFFQLLQLQLVMNLGGFYRFRLGHRWHCQPWALSSWLSGRWWHCIKFIQITISGKNRCRKVVHKFWVEWLFDWSFRPGSCHGRVYSKRGSHHKWAGVPSRCNELQNDTSWGLTEWRFLRLSRIVGVVWGKRKRLLYNFKMRKGIWKPNARTWSTAK